MKKDQKQEDFDAADKAGQEFLTAAGKNNYASTVVNVFQEIQDEASKVKDGLGDDDSE